MSALNSLKFVVAKRPTSLPPIVTKRNKLIANLAEQEAIAKAGIDGVAYSATKSKKVVDAEGNTKVLEVSKRVRRWTYTGVDGKLYLTVRYGSKLMEFAKGKQAIEVGDAAGLLKTLAVLKTAVGAGELDVQINTVARKLI
jgi:hypothetical protein